MATADLTWLCAFFSSLTLTLEFSFYLVPAAFTLEFEEILDYLMLMPEEMLVLMFKLAVDACSDFAIYTSLDFAFGFKPRLMLELVLTMLL